MTMRRWLFLALMGLLLAGMLSAAVPARAAELDQNGVIHVVGRGETLFSIARRYGTSVDAICAANGIADPTRIYAGQRLTIPSSNAASGASSVPAAAGGTHVVRAGENLFRIALRYGVTVQALAELNGIYNPGHVVAGQRLVIPGSATTPSAAYQPQHASTTHTVQRGETLSAIAQRYGVSLWTLVQTNNVANPALILPGQVLVVPSGGSLAPTSAPAPVSTGGKRILIDLSEQHLYAYQGNALIYSFVASTGKPGAGTRAGTFRVLDKYPNAYASTWNLQMPHWLGIYWAGGLENGIHALPIMANGQRLWAGYLGTPVSFGCIILGVEEARLLYQWAEIGTPVVIQY
ncbi:MAG: LysM peptidoglycan-binding domain-containing protein [Chloroflexi bacterium]|nr:LysM peptidoglycan-binding domain-containing protein [Chloroflexota bacterium]